MISNLRNRILRFLSDLQFVDLKRQSSYCNVCQNSVSEWLPMGSRPHARCPHCDSLERHRFVTLFLEEFNSTFVNKEFELLDIAPSVCMTGVFRRLKHVSKYVRMDVDPNADARQVDLVASLTEVPLPSSSQGLIYCSHVLEHIEDDNSAISEMFRLSNDETLVLIQIPYRNLVPTDEQFDVSVEERIRRFGQQDHVRYYGYDFVSRLAKNGFRVFEVNPIDFVSPRYMSKFRLEPLEPLFICTTKDSSKVDFQVIAKCLSKFARV